MTIQTALLSVSDKTNLIPFAKALHQLNVRILSTGGTAKLLKENNIPVTLVSDYTGFPEIMNGRVKTLHPKIYAGLLSRKTIDDTVLAKHKINRIDLVAVNLYPFEQTIAKPDCDLALAIENIDIGGPTMLRAAAKNHSRVTVIVDPRDYKSVLSEIADNNGETTQATRYTLAKKVFAHTARYDTAIAHYLAHVNKEDESESDLLPDNHQVELTKQQDLRYGENPHQQAAFYRTAFTQPQGCIASAIQHQGKPLSFNNISDADAALSCVQQFSNVVAACVIVKHANPCGAAVSDNLVSAYQRAFATDPTSSFGGIIAFNQPLDAATASAILDKQFLEVVIAPEITLDAHTVLTKKQNIRVLSVGTTQPSSKQRSPTLSYRSVSGGMLVQTLDVGTSELNTLRTVTKHQPTDTQLRDLMFAWKVAKSVKSNAIILAKDEATIAIGAGQMSRIDSTKIALCKAAEVSLSPKAGVLASDAFFPFPDNVEMAAEAGISAIIQPGGSIRDKEIIATADKLGLVMVFTSVRHFLH